MGKVLTYAVGCMSAGVAAFVLFVLVRFEMGIARHLIVVDALTAAGVLGLACGIGLLRARK